MDTDTLHAAGVLMLSGDIDRSSVQPIIRSIMERNLSGYRGDIRLFIDSPGGSVDAGFALLDIMAWSRVPIHTTGLGLVGSMALLVMMAGARGHRTLMPRASVLSHRFSTTVQGNHADLLASRTREDQMWERILDHYRRCTGTHDAAILEQELLRPTDRWLTPVEAVGFGLADRVWQSDAALGREVGAAASQTGGQA
jgi:ATP-dependent Clp protease protease subunit